jgi:pimeloyl-ACP methyl ester carboxylesterase
VDRLFLCCPSGIGHQRKGVLLRAIGYGMLGDWGRRRLTAWVLGPAAGRLGSDAPGLDELARLTAKHFRPRTQLVPVFDDGQLASLEMPVRVVVGQLDVMLDSAQTEQRLTAHAPNAEVALLPDVGHLVPIDQGDLSEFLAHR